MILAVQLLAAATANATSAPQPSFMFACVIHPVDAANGEATGQDKRLNVLIDGVRLPPQQSGLPVHLVKKTFDPDAILAGQEFTAFRENQDGQGGGLYSGDPKGPSDVWFMTITTNKNSERDGPTPFRAMLSMIGPVSGAVPKNNVHYGWCMRGSTASMDQDFDAFNAGTANSLSRGQKQ